MFDEQTLFAILTSIVEKLDAMAKAVENLNSIPGDLDNDGDVDGKDVSILAKNLGKTK
jgi:hypothetical protein